MIQTIPLFASSYSSKTVFLTETISCTVTHELNGVYELEMKYPVNGQYADRLEIDSYLDVLVFPVVHGEYYATPPRQRFYITKIVRTSDGVLTIYARHLTYKLSQFLALPGTHNLDGWTTHLNLQIAERSSALGFVEFDIVNSSSASGNLTSDTVRPINSLIFGDDSSIVTLMGVEVDRDNATVTFRDRIGTDRGLKIAYANNIQSFNIESSVADDKYTGAVAFWTDGTTTIRSNTLGTSISSGNIMLIDLSHEYPSAPAVVTLNNRVSQYIAQHPNEFGYSRTSADIVYTPLEGEIVRLGDTVHVNLDMIFGHGIYKDMRVIKTVYDVLSGHYTSVSLGDRRVTIEDTIAKLMSSAGSGSSEYIEGAIDNILGGYKFVSLDSISGNSSHTYNLGNNTRAVIFLTAAANQAGDIVFATATSGGEIQATNIAAGGNYTLTEGTNTLTIRSATGSITTVAALVFAGNVT